VFSLREEIRRVWGRFWGEDELEGKRQDVEGSLRIRRWRIREPVRRQQGQENGCGIETHHESEDHNQVHYCLASEVDVICQD
jgi:hypothetical protein